MLLADGKLDRGRQFLLRHLLGRLERQQHDDHRLRGLGHRIDNGQLLERVRLHQRQQLFGDGRIVFLPDRQLDLQRQLLLGQLHRRHGWQYVDDFRHDRADNGLDHRDVFERLGVHERQQLLELGVLVLRADCELDGQRQLVQRELRRRVLG